MKRLLLLALVLMMGAGMAMAVPAKRGVKKTLTLLDGTRVEATLTGDEHVHYYKTMDGRAIQRLGEAYQYVCLDSLDQLHARRLTARNHARAARRIDTAPEGGYMGSKRGLVILVEFSDLKFTYDKATFNDYFNKVGFNLDGMKGSVHDYFLKQSYGKFDLEFDIAGSVTLPRTAYYYSTDNSRVASMVNQVCEQVDSEVNFARYDWDGDGTVDQVYVIYAGYGEAQGAENTIWPHESTVRNSGSQYQTKENVKIDTYGISCELRGDGQHETGHLDGIGTSCHEFSHCLGLPDFYDTSSSGSNFGMNVWDLMDYGCYNGQSNGLSPCGYTAYERCFAGWLTPVELTSAQQVIDMPAIQDEPVAYIVYNEANPDEYYMLENYQLKSFDEAAYGHGMLVLHVDYAEENWKNNSVNTTPSRQRMTIIPADGRNFYSLSSLAGDPFPGKSDNHELTDESMPQATLYTANVSGEKLMGKPITDIVEKNGLVSFNFMGGLDLSAPAIMEPANPTDNSFTVQWQAIGTATSYTVALTQSIPSDDPRKHIIFSEDFANCVSDVANSTDISASLDDYMSDPGWTGQNLFLSPNKLRVGNARNEGVLNTSFYDGPEEKMVSVMFTPMSAGRTKGSMRIYILTEQGGGTYAELENVIPLPGSDDAGLTWLLSGVDWPYGRFQVSIVPSGSGIYMDWLAAYDGNYSFDDFRSSANAPSVVRKAKANGKLVELDASELDWKPVGNLPTVSRRPNRIPKNTTTYYDTNATNYSFSNLEPAIYYCKVRANTAQGYTDWSDEVVVNLTTAIQCIGFSQPESTGKTYLPDGRQVHGQVLRSGIYLRDGRKFVVK